MEKWVKALYSESEGSWFKPHYVLGRVLGSNLDIGLPETLGLNKYQTHGLISD